MEEGIRNMTLWPPADGDSRRNSKGRMAGNAPTTPLLPKERMREKQDEKREENLGYKELNKEFFCCTSHTFYELHTTKPVSDVSDASRSVRYGQRLVQILGNVATEPRSRRPRGASASSASSHRPRRAGFDALPRRLPSRFRFHHPVGGAGTQRGAATQKRTTPNHRRR